MFEIFQSSQLIELFIGRKTFSPKGEDLSLPLLSDIHSASEARAALRGWDWKIFRQDPVPHNDTADLSRSVHYVRSYLAERIGSALSSLRLPGDLRVNAFTMYRCFTTNRESFCHSSPLQLRWRHFVNWNETGYVHCSSLLVNKQQRERERESWVYYGYPWIKKRDAFILCFWAEKNVTAIIWSCKAIIW